MSPVFADTLYWYGLCNPRDQWHDLVIRARDSLAGRLIVTTDEVLVEFASAMASDRYLRAAAHILIQAILIDPAIRVIPQTHQSFRDGLDLYGNRADKQYSLVDCISMVQCRSEAIEDVLTNDHYFEQEGFVVLIKRA